MTSISDHDIRVALTDASLDAPRIDIWDRIEGQVIDLSRKRHPFRQALRSLAAVLGLMLAGAGMLAIFTLVGDEPERAARQIDSVPDVLLVQKFDEEARIGGLGAYVPETAGFVTVLDNAVSPTIQSAEPLVSRDGSLVIYSGWQRDAETWILRLWALDSATLDIRWSTTIASVPGVPNISWPEVYQSTAISDDHVYIVWTALEGSLPIPLRAYDIATGAEAGSWDIGWDEWATKRTGVLWLAVSPDGDYLQMMAPLYDDAVTTPQPQTAYITFALPEMREITRMILEENVPPDERFSPWSAAFTPDGATIYAINGGYYNDPLRVDFFETGTGAFIDRVELDFGSAFEISQQTALSHDGTRLYIFDAVSSRLAVVDLVTRQLVTSATVDTSLLGSSEQSLLGRVWDAVSGLVVQDAAAKIPFRGSMQLSPDGSRLYAIGIDSQTSAPVGVLVIETNGWQVVERWLPDLNPIKLILSGDGEYLFALTTAWSNQGRTGVRIFHTATGEEVVLSEDLQQTATPYATFSLMDLYRDTWGATPLVAGVDPNAINTATRTVPYARMDVSLSASTVITGQPVTVELRYLDPTSGEPVTEADDDVRFAEPDHVRAFISDRNTSEPVQTIVLPRAADGAYRGAAAMPGPGVWSIQVVAETAGEPARYVTIRDAVVVQQSLTGTDGRTYTLAAELPDPPASAEQPTVVRVRIVDATTGNPLPDGVELHGGLPETMSGSASLENRAVTTATLDATGHGIYEGTFTFYAPGRWLLSSNFPQDGDRSGGVLVGIVVVE